MTDTELGRLVSAAFDDVRFAGTMRGRLRHAVAALIGYGMADADARAGRMAADDLATLFVAQRRAAGRDRVPHAAGVRPVGHRSTAAEDRERRATAFRAMAGVRA